MYLLAGTLYDPASAVAFSTATTPKVMTAFDTTNLRLTFTAPASGIVSVRIQTVLSGGTTFPQTLLGVLDGSTVMGRQVPLSALPGTALATTNVPLVANFLVSGLTPGTSYSWDAAYGVETVVNSTNIHLGGPNDTTANNAWGGFAFEVWDVTSPTNFGALSINSSGQVDVIKVAGTAQTARDLGAQLDTTVSSRLAPTTAGRTLDVTATGAAGIDWSNVENPTTTVGLTGTTISSAQMVASVSGAVASVTGNVGGNVTGAVGSVTGNVGGNVVGSVGSVTAGVTVSTNSDKTGYALTSAYDPAKTAAQAGDAMDLTATGAGRPWDATLSSHLTAGSTGAALNAAGAGGDPWTISLPGAYGAGTAGYIVGTNLDTTVSSRLASGSYTAPDNAGVAAIQAQTDLLSFNGSRVLANVGIPENASFSDFLFVMLDATTGDPLAGLTVTATRTLAGGAFAPCANSPTNVGNGVYAIDLASTDVNAETVAIQFSATGAKTTTVLVRTT